MIYGDGCFHSPDTGINGSSIWEFAETNSDYDIKKMVKKQHSDSTNLVGNMSAQ